MNLKYFHNKTTLTLVVSITVGSGASSPTATEVTHQFSLAPGEQSKLEYGSLQCCYINAISLSYTDDNVQHISTQRTTPGPSSLSRILNESSYLGIISLEPLRFESDV
ncbi:MAG TPA: hypothetical protein DEA26_04945 [Oceanospirillales bacterium]|nr:hypothetical protein [Oceanospirillales bacterium]|tara:strand:- start:3149 stop:3472 length:324 start_codon:yes stop_codon:yes gene_type:complete